jgi:hypothetical protein
VLALPPLRPLVLVTKALLKEAGLNEVFTGGLSSYSLINMTIAHLQAEGLTAAVGRAALTAATSSRSAEVALAGDSTTSQQQQQQQHLQQVAAAAAARAAADHLAEASTPLLNAGAAAAAAAPLAEQAADLDLGCLLLGLFERFSGTAAGGCFDVTNEAVSVAAGGIIDKRPRWVKARQPELLAVEDPQQPGRDIASGSFNITGVQEALAWAADSLRKLMLYFEGSPQGQQQLEAAEASRRQQLVQLPRQLAATAAVSAGKPSRSSRAAAAAAAAAAGSSAAELDEQQQWAAVQAHGQSQSVAVVAEDGEDMEQSLQIEQQQREAFAQDYLMLGNMFDAFAALGRGLAADMQRRQLVKQAAAAKAAARVEQAATSMKSTMTKQQKAELRQKFKLASFAEIKKMPPHLALVVGKGKLKKSDSKHLRNLQRQQEGLPTRRAIHQARAFHQQRQEQQDPQRKAKGKKKTKAKKLRRPNSGGGSGGSQGQRHTPNKRQRQQQQQQQGGYDSSASGSGKKRRRGHGDSGEGGGGRGWGF